MPGQYTEIDMKAEVDARKRELGEGFKERSPSTAKDWMDIAQGKPLTPEPELLPSEERVQGGADQKPKSNFSNLRSLIGQRVVIQEKNGPIALGLFESFDQGEGYLKLTGAQITGRGKKVSPPFVLVHFTAIAHIHPEVEAEKA